MEFNKYIWDLYANSEKGRAAIEQYALLDLELMDRKEAFESFTWDLNRPDMEDIRQNFDGDTLGVKLLDAVIDEANTWEVSSIDEAISAYNSLIDSGLTKSFTTKNGGAEGFPVIGCSEEDDHEWSDYIRELSIGLFKAKQEYFLPYLFKNKFYQLQQISSVFNIPLPRVPKKHDELERAYYYGHLSTSFYDFRVANNLTSTEMCAFLYDFAPNFISDSTGLELPKPTKAWILKGGINDNGDYENIQEGGFKYTSHWQGNIDTRRGDILVMYFLAPQKKVHFIARAMSDGFIDPYFHYHSTIWIQNPIPVSPIEFKELKAHPVLGNNPGIKASMQGPSGVPLTSQEYDAILEMIKDKGGDITDLPRLAKIDLPTDVEVLDEKDVEERLIEPLLLRLGYTASDWRRQVPVRMGRGERNYPDYIIGLKETKDHQSAKLILEAKYRVTNQKQLREAFLQSNSYAYRLQSPISIVAAQEGIWICTLEKSRFDIVKAINKTWGELATTDHFNEVKLLIGKGEI